MQEAFRDHVLTRRAGIRERRPTGSCVVLTRRKPRLLLRLPGVFLLRFAERKLKALLFQLPPRLTRFVPLSERAPQLYSHFGYTSASEGSKKRRRASTTSAWATWPIMLVTRCASSASLRIPATKAASRRSMRRRKRRHFAPWSRTPPGRMMNPRNGMPQATGPSSKPWHRSSNGNVMTFTCIALKNMASGLTAGSDFPPAAKPATQRALRLLAARRARPCPARVKG